MTTTILPRPAESQLAGLSGISLSITLVLALWLLLVVVLGNFGAFVDLVVAVSIGALSATLATGAPGGISTAPMATLPLLLIPAFLVPLFLMLHTAALVQSRQIIRGRA
jgi:hypothetical protein